MSDIGHTRSARTVHTVGPTAARRFGPSVVAASALWPVDFRPRGGVGSISLRGSAARPFGRRAHGGQDRYRNPRPRPAAPGGAGLQAGAPPQLERVSELCDLVDDHLDPGGVL